MNQLSVLNTRPREQAAELSRLLRLAGFDVVDAPAIAIEPAWVASELAAVRAELAADTFAWVVLASANAGRALAAELSRARVLCGAATAHALRVRPSLSLDHFSAAAALDRLRTRVRSGERVLVPRAAQGRNELIDGLRALGVAVVAPVAYRTVAVPEAAAALRSGGIDVVALCSPSAVASVAAAVPSEILVVCLGETTAEAARQAGLRVAGVARETSMPELVRAIETTVGASV